MTIERKDRVYDQSSSSTGTGPMVLDGVTQPGFQPFSAHTNGATVHYMIMTADQTSWEVGEGKWTAGTSTLSRTKVLTSSNGNSLVNFPAGLKIVMSGPTSADFATYIGNTQPSVPTGIPYLWVQTGLGTSGTDWTLWIEDGQ